MSDRVLTNAVTGVSIRIVRSGAETRGELLELEATYPAVSAAPPSHYHPAQEEHFLVLDGRMQVDLDGRRRVLEHGGTLVVPAGTPHAMWNADPTPARVRWETRPAGSTEEFFRVVYHLAALGRTDAHGTPGLRDLAWLVPRYWDVMRVTRPPAPLQRVLFAMLRPLALGRAEPVVRAATDAAPMPA